MKLLVVLLISRALAANWAVLVSTSSSWYDYRHSSNVLAMYEQALGMGIPESNIVLLSAGQHQSDPRNLYPGQQKVSETETVAVRRPHYAGRQVTTRALHSVLTGRHALGKTIGSDETSTVLLFLTGHGGDGVLGFEDGPLEVGYLDRILNEMWTLGLYKQLLLVVDSCQSATMLDVSAPNVVAVAGADRGNPSYSRRRERTMGISLVDEFSWATTRVLAGLMRVGTTFSASELLAGYGALGVPVFDRATAFEPECGRQSADAPKVRTSAHRQAHTPAPSPALEFGRVAVLLT